eukprot:542616-Rhodomonas_salina.1
MLLRTVSHWPDSEGVFTPKFMHTELAHHLVDMKEWPRFGSSSRTRLHLPPSHSSAKLAPPRPLHQPLPSSRLSVSLDGGRVSGEERAWRAPFAACAPGSPRGPAPLPQPA